MTEGTHRLSPQKWDQEDAEYVGVAAAESGKAT